MGRKTNPRGTAKQVGLVRHKEAKRLNIPTGEQERLAEKKEGDAPVAPVAYPRRRPLAKGESRPRNSDKDPQLLWQGARIRLNEQQLEQARRDGFVDIGEAALVWRGKDEKDWSQLVVPAPPVYIQEKIQPKAIVDALINLGREEGGGDVEPWLFDDFNGLEGEARTEFYQHEQNWSNRMILGDSLHAMASLAEREKLRGSVQCIYFDPPYGVKFNSNWQVSTRSRNVRDGRMEDITREAEQIKAYRDVWRDGIHSYLTYLRDRLSAMRDLLTEGGSIFVQIGDENVHRIRAVMDEVLGEDNFVQQIIFRTTAPLGSDEISAPVDYILWFSKNKEAMKYRAIFEEKEKGKGTNYMWTGFFDQRRRLTSIEVESNANLPEDIFYPSDFASSGYTETCFFDFELLGHAIKLGKKSWRTNARGTSRLKKAWRLMPLGEKHRPCFIQYHRDNPLQQKKNTWLDTRSAMDKNYVVQTQDEVIKRCLLMSTDPGDLVLDPSCGAGTTAYVAEQWGRRWITMDTSRVALALARARLMGARYPFWLLADSAEGRKKEQQLTGGVQPDTPALGDIRQGFVCERVPHITLKSIARNAEIDVIWDNWQETLEPLRHAFNKALGKDRQEWEIPRAADSGWSEEACKLHEKWWRARLSRQKEIDESIARNARVEFLYDRPYESKSCVRVSGPFTVESLSPHRVLPSEDEGERGGVRHTPFATIILEHLRKAGVHRSQKKDRITFTQMRPLGGDGILAAKGIFSDGTRERRAAIFIGPEFGSVTGGQLRKAAEQAAKGGFDVLIACGFHYDVHTSEWKKLSGIPILKARMNPDLHMGEELANTGSGNLFVVFGEPDIEWRRDEKGRIIVEIRGVDVFDSATGALRSGGTDDIAAWFIDTAYNDESFFVRHAYFPGGNDPYKSLKIALKAELSMEAWQSLRRTESRPFPVPEKRRFAVKVINHFGDEVMKIFKV